MQRFPFTNYPIGWFAVVDSEDVAPGTIVPRHVLGQELICYRGESGAVRVADAFCPHNGAHLGYGGTIDGDDLLCPFHGWRFGANGENVDVPYADRPRRGAQLRFWHSREMAGYVFAWHDPQGGPPLFELPNIPEATDPEYVRHVPPGAEWHIRTHVQEILENTVDLAHFRFVHKVSGFLGATITVDGANFRSVADVVFPTPRGDTSGQVESDLWGLGIDVVRRRGIGPQCPTIMTVTPVDVDDVMARYTFFLPRGHEDGLDGDVTHLGQAHVRDFMKQIERDIPIWEHKIYRSRPKLTKEEAAVAQFRRWARQFYGTANAISRIDPS